MVVRKVFPLLSERQVEKAISNNIEVNEEKKAEKQYFMTYDNEINCKLPKIRNEIPHSTQENLSQIQYTHKNRLPKKSLKS